MTGTPASTAISERPRSAAAGDAELYPRLVAEGFTGPVYKRLMDRRLCPYGYRVIHSWITTGLIFSRCAEKQIKGLPAGEDWAAWTDQDIEDLVQETLVNAELKFRSDGRAGKGWRPDGGASLAAYFITGCLFAFASVYKSHRRQKNQHQAAHAAAQRTRPRDHAPDVADALSDCAEAAERLDQMVPDPRLRLVMQCHADGHSYAEISHLLADGTTPRAVEGMIYRCKRRAGEAPDGHR